MLGNLDVTGLGLRGRNVGECMVLCRIIEFDTLRDCQSLGEQLLGNLDVTGLGLRGRNVGECSC